MSYKLEKYTDSLYSMLPSGMPQIEWRYPLIEKIGPWLELAISICLLVLCYKIFKSNCEAKMLLEVDATKWVAGGDGIDFKGLLW
jgi:hypothetical protein